MDLRIAVEHIYKELITSMNKELDFSPLHVAARFGQLTLFNDILQKVENKFPTDGHGRTTLHHAASKDLLQIYESIHFFGRAGCRATITNISFDVYIFQ